MVKKRIIKEEAVKSQAAAAEAAKDKAKNLLSVGKRKKAIARASIVPGKGTIRINSVMLEGYTNNEFILMRIKEPILLASDYIDPKKIDITINVHGGGVCGQVDAMRSAMARGLVEYTENKELLATYVDYDRTLIAGDHRLTEPHKPSQSSKGPRHKKQKSYR